MTGFDTQTSGIGSNRSTNWATTTALCTGTLSNTLLQNYSCEIEFWNDSKLHYKFRQCCNIDRFLSFDKIQDSVKHFSLIKKIFRKFRGDFFFSHKTELRQNLKSSPTYWRHYLTKFSLRFAAKNLEYYTGGTMVIWTIESSVVSSNPFHPMGNRTGR